MMKKRRPKKNKINPTGIITFAGAFAAAFTCFYCICVFANIPFIRYWRDIWIETAMTTGEHQWLATSFIPSSIIDSVMENQNRTHEISGGEAYLEKKENYEGAEEAVSLPSKDKPAQKDILGQKDIAVGEKDYAGYTVLVNDIEQGLVISEIVGDTYKGRIMLIDDPSRVYLGVTTKKNVEGMRILDMMEHYGAVAGINASGFNDPNGQGSGGHVMGISCSQGQFWGNYVNFFGSVVFTSSDKLVVGNLSSTWDDYNIRDGIQFGPVLIANGEVIVTGSAGWGIQPRTAIGQREDGVIAFLVVDGRDLSYSVGCTVGDLAEILKKYNIINAACCDGGASSALAYGGELITKNTSLNPTIGRLLPNAFLVSPKETE